RGRLLGINHALGTIGHPGDQFYSLADLLIQPVCNFLDSFVSEADCRHAGDFLQCSAWAGGRRLSLEPINLDLGLTPSGLDATVAESGLDRRRKSRFEIPAERDPGIP